MSELTLIGLSGKAGSGKDYLAEHYLRPLGFLPVALADGVKDWAIARGLCTYEEAYHTKPPHVREVLQQLGTEEGRRVFGENLWCLHLHARLRRIAERWGLTKFAVTDIRFPNEVTFVQQRDGVVYRLFAPDRVAATSLTALQRVHDSEIALDPYDPVEANGKWVHRDTTIKYDALIDNRTRYAPLVDTQMTHALRVHDIIPPDASVSATRGGDAPPAQPVPPESVFTPQMQQDMREFLATLPYNSPDTPLRGRRPVPMTESPE